MNLNLLKDLFKWYWLNAQIIYHLLNHLGQITTFVVFEDLTIIYLVNRLSCRITKQEAPLFNF